VAYAQGAPPVVPVNLSEAERWLDRACAAGAPQGCLGLGAVRETVARRAESPDLGPAEAAYTRGCEAEVLLACAAQAALYERGERDGDPAPLRDQACGGGHAESCVALGAHREGLRDPEGAADAYRRGCAAGGPEGCAALGAMLLLGPRSLRDRDAAAIHLGVACDAGLGPTCAVLATVSDDPAEALARWQQGCEHGHAWSCRRAGRLLKRDDPEAAATLQERSCELGFRRGCGD
jgi:TPR repeat protein